MNETLRPVRTEGFDFTNPAQALRPVRTDGFDFTNPAQALRPVRCMLSLVRELQLYPILVAMAAGLIGAILSIHRGQSPFYGFGLYAWATIGVLIGLIFLVYFWENK